MTAAAVLAAQAGPGRPALAPASVLPPGFYFEEHLGEDKECSPWPGEEDLVGPVWARNRYRSLMARDCARRGLVRLGHPPAPIPRLPQGGPAWPDGIVGSLTHCEGYRAAIVGRTSAGRSAGIDAEPHVPLPPGVLDLIANPAEQRMIGRLHGTLPDIHWDTLLFCAKEAVYKAWFPLTNTWLPMTQGTAWISSEGGFRVTIRLRQHQPGDLSLLTWTGRWMLRDEFIVAAVVREPLS